MLAAFVPTKITADIASSLAALGLDMPWRLPASSPTRREHLQLLLTLASHPRHLTYFA
jgi:hypothetical protein